MQERKLELKEKKLHGLWEDAAMSAIKNFQDSGGVSATKTAAENNDVKNSIREEFYNEFDAWDKKNPSVTFTIGNTSDVLQSIGIKQQEIKMRSGMILNKINKHPEISADTFREIPKLLENPIIVQFSDAIDPNTQEPKYKSRITVMGELYADMLVDGKAEQKPVLVSIELLPTNQKATRILDVAIITNAYVKDKLQQYINENSILYVEPNKKRTNRWLTLNRLQLPVGETRYGSIRKITYTDGKVKIENSKNETPMQRALRNAGVIDSYGNIISNEQANDTDNTKKSDRNYSYNELIAKPDLQGTVISKSQQVKLLADGSIDVRWVVNEVKKKCAHIQTKSSEPTYYVSVPDIGKNVEIISRGIHHGFIKSEAKNGKPVPPHALLNARVSLELPQILSNSIEVNRSSRSGNLDIPFAHIMIGTVGLENSNGGTEYYVVRSVIEERKNQNPLFVEAEILGRLKGINAKK